MLVILTNIYHLLNIPLDGDIIFSNFKDFSRSSFNCPSESSRLSYTSFLAREIGKPDSDVTFQEVCSFYLYWLCKFVVCSSTKRNTFGVCLHCYDFSLELSIGPWPFMLCLLYRSLLSLTQERFFGSVNGPLWLLQLWVYAYFSNLSPVPINY